METTTNSLGCPIPSLLPPKQTTPSLFLLVNKPKMEDMYCEPETTTTMSSKVAPPPPQPKGYHLESPQFVSDELQCSYYELMQQQERWRRYAEASEKSSYGQQHYLDDKTHDSYCEYSPVKRVTFAEDAYLYSSDVTPEEVKPMWYTPEDFRRFKDERKDALRRMKQMGLDVQRLENEGYAVRGLEPYFSVETNRAIKAARKKAVDTIFIEQHRQRSLRIYDEERLRILSSRDTKWATDVALKLAANDAHDVKRDSTEPARSIRLSSIDRRQREEFVRTAAFHREKSNRKLRVHEDEDDARRTVALMNKLQNSLRIEDAPEQC